MSLTRDRAPPHAILALCALAALGAWAACIVACGSRPGWSPDGTQVVFAYLAVDGAGGGPGGLSIGLALHDLRTGETRQLGPPSPPTKEQPPPAKGSDDTAESETETVFPIFTRWLADGRRLLAILPRSDPQADPQEKPKALFHISLVDTHTGALTKSFELRDDEQVLTAFFVPPPLVSGRWLFFGGKTLARLDLETGEVTKAKSDLEEEHFLLEAGAGVVYVAQKPRGKETFTEIGTVDGHTLALTPLSDLSELGISSLESLPAASRDGKRLAFVADKGDAALCVVEDARVEKSIPIEAPGRELEFANLAWSDSESIVYAAYGLDRAGEHEYGVAEFPIGGGHPTYRKLLAVSKPQKKNPAKDEHTITAPVLFHFQLALSPDGKTLAVSSALFPPKALRDDDRVLFLVDLTRPDRPVTRVRPPAAPATPARAEPERPK